MLFPFGRTYQRSRIAAGKLLRGEGLPMARLGVAVLLGATLCWAYWPMFASIAERWAHEPQYSHGYFVPLFALFLLWDRRQHCPQHFQGASVGALVVGTGAVLYLGGTLFHVPSVTAVSLLPSVLGIFLLVGGVNAARWSWPAICFLLFMLPLPFRIEVSLAHPLQRLATTASTATLITLGFQATADGNIITVNDSEILVAQACGGLSMCLTFLALTVGCALVIRRPLLDKLVLIVSAIPIALIANVTRITITGVLNDLVGSNAARSFYHDFAGWFMMPFALGMVWLILWILARLLVGPGPAGPLPIYRVATPRACQSSVVGS
jgi:exosortase